MAVYIGFLFFIFFFHSEPCGGAEKKNAICFIHAVLTVY